MHRDSRHSQITFGGATLSLLWTRNSFFTDSFTHFHTLQILFTSNFIFSFKYLGLLHLALFFFSSNGNLSAVPFHFEFKSLPYFSAEMKYSKTACKIVIAPPQCGEAFAEMEISSSVSVFLGQKSALKEISFFSKCYRIMKKLLNMKNGKGDKTLKGYFTFKN